MATHLLRATDTKPLAGWTSHGGVSMNDVYWLPRPEKFFGYAPMRSPSVFNFFSPNFVPSDETLLPTIGLLLNTDTNRPNSGQHEQFYQKCTALLRAEPN